MIPPRSNEIVEKLIELSTQHNHKKKEIWLVSDYILGVNNRKEWEIKLILDEFDQKNKLVRELRRIIKL